MKKNLLTIASVIITLCLGINGMKAQLSPIQWGNSFGDPNDNERALSTIVDSNGDVITTGYFTGTVDFDPNNSNTTLTSLGGQDVFVVKHDKSGNFLWVAHIGSPGGDDRGTGVTFDSNNDIYVTGYFEDNCDFDPYNSNFTFNTQGKSDAFVVYLDGSSGAFYNAYQIGGGGYDYAHSISIDPADYPTITGSFDGNCEFDFNNSTQLNAFGLNDGFVAQIDPGLSQLTWVHQFGDAGYEEGLGIAIDSNWDFNITGYFEGSCDFDPFNSNTILNSQGQYDAFAFRLDNGGNFSGTIYQAGGSGDDIAYGVAVDQNDDVYVTGSFENSCDIDLLANSFVLNSAGQMDAFVARLDYSSFKMVWGQQMGGSQDEIGRSLTVPGNEVFVTGSFESTADFDPFNTNHQENSAGGKDIFVTTYDVGTGKFVHVDVMGATDNEEGMSISMAYNSQDAHLAGYFGDKVDFDPTSGSYALKSQGFEDVFIAKYGGCNTAVMTSITTATNNICAGATITLTVNGTLNTATAWQLYTGSCGGTLVGSNATGTFAVSPGSNTTYFAKPTGGCGTYNSCVQINIITNTVPTPAINSSTTTSCAGSTISLVGSGATTYSWIPGSFSGATFVVSPTTSTTYTLIGGNGGCKVSTTQAISVLALPTVTITSSPTVACAGSSVTLTLTGGLTTYTWSNGTANASSIVVTPTSTTTYSVAGDNGTCSNTKSLTVNTSNNPTITATSSHSLYLCTGQSVTITANGAGTYSWSNGSTNVSIVDSPTTTTTYTVTGYNGFGCASAPVVITQSVSTCTGIDNVIANNNSIIVYPNPNNGLFNVVLNNISHNPVIEIFDAVGKQISSKSLSEIETQVNISGFASGVYYFKIKDNTGELKYGKLIKE